MLGKLACEGLYLNRESYMIVLNSLGQTGKLEKTCELLDLMLSRVEALKPIM